MIRCPNCGEADMVPRRATTADKEYLGAFVGYARECPDCNHIEEVESQEEKDMVDG